MYHDLLNTYIKELGNMVQLVNLPEALAEREGSWEVALIEEEMSAHNQAYDRALRIAKAFWDAGMDAWLNPDGNHDPTAAPQYQLDGNLNLAERVHEIDLNAKINNKNFYIASAREVEHFGGTLAQFPSQEDNRGICLYNERQANHPALSSTSRAFRFIDSVLIGLEKQAVDLSVLQLDDVEPTAVAA